MQYHNDRIFWLYGSMPQNPVSVSPWKRKIELHIEQIYQKIWGDPEA